MVEARLGECRGMRRRDHVDIAFKMCVVPHIYSSRFLFLRRGLMAWQTAQASAIQYCTRRHSSPTSSHAPCPICRTHHKIDNSMGSRLERIRAKKFTVMTQHPTLRVGFCMPALATCACSPSGVQNWLGRAGVSCAEPGGV